MFYEKYEPKQLNEIKGNESGKNRLYALIKNHSNNAGVIVCGPSGVGKDISVKCICKELKFNLVEVEDINHLKSFYSKSDETKFSIQSVLYKKTEHGIEKYISQDVHIVFLRDIDSFMEEYSETIRSVCDYLAKRKELIINKLNNKRLIPPFLVITCNDAFIEKLKLIRKYNENNIIRFYPLSSEDIEIILMWTIRQYRQDKSNNNLWIWPKEYDKECCSIFSKSSNGDIRNVLNSLYMFLIGKGSDLQKESEELDFSSIDDAISDLNFGIFDACDNLFNYPGKSSKMRQKSFQKKFTIADIDSSFLPAMVHENILTITDNYSLDTLSECMDSFSQADMIDKQGWSLQSYSLLSSCVKPTLLIHKSISQKPKLQFPKLFSNASITKKHKSELRRILISNHRFIQDIDAIYYVGYMILQPLIVGSNEALSESLSLMKSNHISRDVLNDICSLCFSFSNSEISYEKISSKMKSMLTRRLNGSNSVEKKSPNSKRKLEIAKISKTSKKKKKTMYTTIILSEEIDCKHNDTFNLLSWLRPKN